MKGSIVQIARTLPFHGHGGMETHAWELAKAWKRRGWDVEILTTSFEERTFVKDIDGIRIHALRHMPLNRDEVPNWRWFHRFAGRLRDYALAHRIDADIVHSESVYGHALFRALRRRRAPIARTMTIHGTGLLTYQDSSRRQLLKTVPAYHPRAIGQWLYVKQRAWREAHLEYPTAQRLVTVSDRIADHLVEDYHLPRDRVEVIPNGVDEPLPRENRDAVRAELGIPHDARIILYLGRLEPSKRVDTLLHHLPHHPHDRLLVAGSGSDELRLQGLALALPNAGAVRFLGPVTHEMRRKLFVAADVFALPSESEGQPITLLEALAAGTPVYARRPWVPHELAPLVRTGDDVTAGIDEAYEHREHVEQSADVIASQYSWDRIAERYEDAFARSKP